MMNNLYIDTRESVIGTMLYLADVAGYKTVGRIRLRNKEREVKKMKHLRRIDRKFAEIGLVKVNENRFGVSYERNLGLGIRQRIDLVRKRNGFHQIHCYEKSRENGNAIGLTMYEARLCRKKMKQMGWNEQKGRVGL